MLFQLLIYHQNKSEGRFYSAISMYIHFYLYILCVFVVICIYLHINTYEYTNN